MVSLKNYQQIIEEEIQKVDLGKTPFELYEPIKYTLSLGGKRIRPILVLMGCNLFNENFKNALPQAIAIELFHNFTLIHDDIMDNAPLRRNQPTVHKKWNVNNAILSGDALLVKAYQYLVDCSASVLPEILMIFNQTAIEVCEGQQMDMNFEKNKNVSVGNYLKMIELKTAVLIAAGFKIGAIVGGANQINAIQLYEFGKNIGIAFQLKDDLLDVFGNTDKLGKQKAGDIVSNKKTFLFLKALELADDNDNERLIYYYSDRESDLNVKVNEVKKIFESLNVMKYTEELMMQYYNQAFTHFNNLSISETAKAPLKLLVESLIHREN